MRKLSERDQPFFLAAGFVRPHLPFVVPRKYWEMYNRAKIPLAKNTHLPKNAPSMAVNTIRELRGYVDFREAPTPDQGQLTEAQSRLLRHGYFASVTYIDAQVGRLLEELERLGLRENTIVVLWGDHGWKLGEHGSWCKMTNYEIDTRVPLIVRAPAAKENGKQCDRLVEFVDIYPTLCSLVGLDVPEHLEGTSFAPLLDDCSRPWKTAVFSQFLREGKWVGPDGKEYMGHSIRTERYRYVEWTNWATKENVGCELYDHRADPQENVNIADLSEKREIVEELAAKLRAGWKAALPNRSR
jgi:arylsulfatase A-like enzyme